MKIQKLYIAMVGLPARGKSTIAAKLREHLTKDAIDTRVFNNGVLRRRLSQRNTSYPEFYDPQNTSGCAFREKIALMNMHRAQEFLGKGGSVAILDATNASRKRRATIVRVLQDHPVLFIECLNDDSEILAASIRSKVTLPEFRHLDKDAAIASFQRRIDYYHLIYSSLQREKNYIKIDSLCSRILDEELTDDIPYFDRIRDILVTDTVKNLYLVRHGETYFNLENRIGGDSELTPKGIAQAQELSLYFKNKKIPFIFTSTKKRTIQSAEPIQALQNDCTIIEFAEFDEIDSGVCECMSYEEIRDRMPEVYFARKQDKYNYIYPRGEGYVSMKERIDRGIKKALYLSSESGNLMIIGHRAVNRMILSHFLYRRTEDVPFIFVPQEKFYHIVSAQDKKLFQLKKYTRG
jgi:broad specificity phosphatase PhoE/predicted kinase